MKDPMNTKPAEKKQKPQPAPAGALIAKKPFTIHWNDYHCEIKAGDDLSDVPAKFHQNLKTEGVL